MILFSQKFIRIDSAYPHGETPSSRMVLMPVPRALREGAYRDGRGAGRAGPWLLRIVGCYPCLAERIPGRTREQPGQPRAQDQEAHDSHHPQHSFPGHSGQPGAKPFQRSVQQPAQQHSARQ